MKKTLILVFDIMTLTFYTLAEVKIGVINAGEIVQKTKKGNKIQKKLEVLQKKKAAELEGAQNNLKQLQKDLASPAINADTREKKTREMEDARIKYNRLLQDAQKSMQSASQKELMDLQKE
ncbi:MAG: OmpH family outer membrane protein, partial [bacterium]|nr:OmpH family outer membrane protein [bacterium]